MNGRITSCNGSLYQVLTDDGKSFCCRLRGKFRLEDKKENNPIAVGDRVEFIFEDDIGSITKILQRDNFILRKSIKKEWQSQVLASNIDQVLIMATLFEPRTSMSFIDRVMVSAESFRIPQLIFINKKDLMEDVHFQEVKTIIDCYDTIGVPVKLISALDNNLYGDIVPFFQNKTNLIVGLSGVGKSTLMNVLGAEINQKVGEISKSTNKGIHTTTFAEMFRIQPSTYIIDTPGVKEWGLVDMNQQEISDYFPEMRDRRLNCKYGSKCLHLKEPGCAILMAVNNGEISTIRYKSYLSMVIENDNRK